jgi:acetyltransferase-like isoleucine patch superfamily enzyme
VSWGRDAQIPTAMSSPGPEPTPAPSDVPDFLVSGGRAPLRLVLRRARLRLRFGRGLELGRRAFVGKGVRLRLERGGRLVLGAGAWLGDRSTVRASGEVRIGAGTLVGPESVLAADELVAIGDACLLGDEVMLNDAALTVEDAARPDGRRPLTVRPVLVGDRVRIGPRACLLAGASVGSDTVVGPRAVVNGPVAEGAVVGGVPGPGQKAATKGAGHGGSDTFRRI